MINLLNKEISFRLKSIVLMFISNRNLKNFTEIIKFLDGTRAWYLNGFHRKNGLVVEWSNGKSYSKKLKEREREKLKI